MSGRKDRQSVNTYYMWASSCVDKQLTDVEGSKILLCGFESSTCVFRMLAWRLSLEAV